MKYAKYLFVLTLCLFLAACGPKPAEAPPEASAPKPAVSQPEPDESEPDVSEPPTQEPAVLTEEDKAAAHDAAMDYYTGTVFEVDSLTEIEPRQGEIAFRVNCSKNGVKVDPDRTISLERQEGVWTVINEGY